MMLIGNQQGEGKASQLQYGTKIMWNQGKPKSVMQHKEMDELTSWRFSGRKIRSGVVSALADS